MAIDYSMLGLIIIIGAVFIGAALSMKFVVFNMKLLFRVLTWKKHNVGLIFFRNLGNSFTLPQVVCIRENRSEAKEGTRVFTREMFTEGTWFGYPYAIMDKEDMKTTYGLYKAQCDEKGVALCHTFNSGRKDENGKYIYIQTKVPMLDKIKTSVSISPELIKTVIASAALNSAIKDFLDKNKYILWCAGGAAILSAGALFFSYNNQNSIAQFCGEQLTQKTASIIQVCQNALTNLSSVR